MSKNITMGKVRIGLKSCPGESLASRRSRISSRTIFDYTIVLLILFLDWKTRHPLDKDGSACLTNEIRTV